MERRHVAPSVVQMVLEHWTRWNTAPAAPRQTASISVEQLRNYGIPGLVVAGEWDIDEHHAIADGIDGAVPSFQKVTMPWVGHLPNMEDHSAFNRTVSDFPSKDHSTALRPEDPGRQLRF